MILILRTEKPVFGVRGGKKAILMDNKPVFELAPEAPPGIFHVGFEIFTIVLEGKEVKVTRTNSKLVKTISVGEEEVFYSNQIIEMGF